MNIKLLLFTGCIALLISCKTQQESKQSTDQFLTIELQEKISEDYLTKTYASYQPSDIKRSNRTLNQFRVKFHVTKEQYQMLLKQLEEDPNIVKIHKPEEIQPPTNSTNQKSGKSKPIKQK